MNKLSALYYFLIFTAYLLLQVLFFDNMVLFGTAFCFVYVGFLLLLPIEMSPVLLISIGFFSGLGVDLFYNSMGVNASAGVILAFIRPFWMSSITPRGGYEEIYTPTLKSLGTGWFITYALPLLFIHHLSLFLIEMGGFSDFWFVLKKTIFSTLYTFIIIVVGQFLFYNKSK